jgi:hypothetical protein
VVLRNSKDLLDNNKSRSFSQVSSIKTFDFSTLYTTLPHGKLKTRLKETIHKAFSHWNYGSNILASRIFLSFTSFWRNSDSYEYNNKSARRGAQIVPIGILKTRLKETIHKAFSHWNYGSNIFATIPHIIKTNFKKVKHATPRNKWSVSS